jgi:hypothetical protein
MAVDSVTAKTAPHITGAIDQAARSTGTSFQYLLITAQIESNLNPSAQASTSSAKGLFQFIDQTWLGTVKKEGAALGLGAYADAITQSPDGRYDVADPAARAAIMKLRSDPAASAMMAGAFTRANASQLQGAIGRAPTDGELYIAHFLGPDNAGKMINAAANQPQTAAASLFPQAAAANQSIFYDSAGRARPVSAVYARLTGKFDGARSVAAAPVFRPALAQTAAMTPVISAPLPAPDPAGVTKVFASANPVPPRLADAKPLFQAMFTDRAQAITQTVSSLWAPPKSGDASASARAAPPREPVRTLDLFTDRAPDGRKLSGG